MADVSKATQMNNGLAIQVYNEQSCLLMEKRMRAAYQSAIDELQKELDDFYEKYAANNKIDLQVAKQKLSLSDSENVKDLAEQYKQLLSKKNIGVRTQKKLDEIAAKTKVSRLEQLLVNCTKQAAEVGMKAKDEMIDVGSLMYKDGFGHTMFNIQKTVGMGVNFNMPSARVIKTASNVEWLGATFTDRTGYTLDRLTNNIEQIIPQLFIQGKNADEFGKAIAKQFNMSENAAKRDMRTLTTLITNQASILAYNNCEMVDEFEFVATLDGKTSDKCRAMDGKRFKLNEAAPFVNQPPLHYNCRSTTIPYFEDLDEYNPSERVARDEQGKTYMVPANMSYREWCTKHAQGLYANSDKTDWNYEPEKVLAYERIVDERRKLKALQEDRVVYQDSDFVVDHDISSYSEEEIKHLMQLFNVYGDAGVNLLQEAKQKLQSERKYVSDEILLGNEVEHAYMTEKSNIGGYGNYILRGYTDDRKGFIDGIARNIDVFTSISQATYINDKLKVLGKRKDKALYNLYDEMRQRILSIVDNTLNPQNGNGLLRFVDERKQHLFLNIFNDKYINNGNIDMFVDVQSLILNNIDSFRKYTNHENYKVLYNLKSKLDFNEISVNDVQSEIYKMFKELSVDDKIDFIRTINNYIYDYNKPKIDYLVDINRNDIVWGARLLKPKITSYTFTKEETVDLFSDSLKNLYIVVNNTLDGFDKFFDNFKEIDVKTQLQQKINETMTRINNIRKELNSDKTANILPAKDYNDIIGNLHKYYEMLNDEYDILNEKSSYQKYVKVMGLNEKPQTMSRKDFESYTKKNKDLPVFYRAVTDAGPTGTAGGITRGKYLRRGTLNDLMYGSQQYIGDGIYGDGLYFSTQPTHKNYGGFSGSANEAIDRKYMIKATFKSGTKKILYDDLEKMIDEYKEKGYNITDPSSFARSLGYHVIQAHKDGESEIYYNIIDRSCLVVQDVDKSNEVEIKKKRERKIIDIKQTKQKISDNVKQQMPTYDKTTINNIKKAVNDGKSNDDAMRFIVDRMLLDDDVFSDLNILSNFENYIKEAVDDDDVYENAFNRTYDELYKKMDKLLDTDVPHEFALYKRKDGTKVQTDLIFSDLEDWLFEMEKVKDSDVVAKSFVLEKIRYQIYNEYVNDFSRRFIGELKESEYDDVDKLVKSYNNKFIKRSQELIEQAVPKKVSISKGGKVGPHILNDEEVKALERKDTYDFNELRRKAAKEFKYYKGTMKKAETQNESLRQSEKISKNNEKYFHQTMLDIFEKNDFCMRLNKNVLPLIAQSKFMNQFETGSAPLGLTFNQRRVVAKKMFTIPQDAEDSEYEKYGFLGSKNPKDDFKDDESFTGDYGDSIVRFKKRNLMHRTTFTIGDSLFNCMHDDVRSSPVINPQIASIQRGHVNEVIYGLNVVENANAEKSYLDIQALTRQKYIELQYHGNLTIDDVESVTFNAKNTNPNNPEVRKIIAMLKERGIKCYLSNSKSEVIEEL